MSRSESESLSSVDAETTVHPAYHQLANVIVRYGSKVLLLYRKTEPFSNMWSLPGGGREEGETYIDAALRELYEETQIRANELKPLYVFLDHEHRLESHLFEHVSPDGKFVNSEQSEHGDMRWHDIETAMSYRLTPGVYEALQALR
jgi:8-oxo-dGTP diphosphatase